MSLTLRAAVGLFTIGIAGAGGAAYVFGGAGARVPGAAPQETADAILTLADWPTTPAIRRGRVVYEQNCIGCHGAEGEGDGEAAAWLEPPPRNFQKARFKFRSTGSGQLPFEDDVFRTVTCGLPGSAMPGFPLLAEHQRRDVVAYVLDLAVFNQARIVAEIAIGSGESTRGQILADPPGLRAKAIEASLGKRRREVAPPYPAPTKDSIEKGRAQYAKVCGNCHGDLGRGDGFSAYALRDWQDAAIVPRDFTTGVFRAGSGPADLFLRIRTGLNGTPMPGTNEPDDVVWGMVHYIQSMQTPGVIPITRRMGCDTHE